jgi:hypothetical protein
LPCGVEDGIRQEIGPGEVPANVPIETGVVKLPDASLNSAVKILLPTTLPESVKEILSVAPAQIVVGTVPTIGCAPIRNIKNRKIIVSVFFIQKTVLKSINDRKEYVDSINAISMGEKIYVKLYNFV